MADPITVLGGIAAISQLVKYSFDVFRRLKELSSPSPTADELIRDLSHFIALAEYLKLQPCIHSLDVGLVIDECISPAVALRQLLEPLTAQPKDTRRSGFLKRLALSSRKNSIARKLDLVERGKLTLLLYSPLFDYRDAVPVNLQLSKPISASSPIFMVDAYQNPTHIRRESIMRQLSTHLEGHNNDQIAALVGLGGVGKSEIAIEYAYERAKTPGDISVFWINAESEETFEDDFLHIASQAQSSGKCSSHIKTISEVASWLESSASGNWLIILDALEERTLLGPRAFQRHIPRRNNCSILLTTQNKHCAMLLARQSQIIETTYMDKVEARALLAQYTDLTRECEEDIMTFILAFETHPLALAQAGSYVAANAKPISSFLRLLDSSDEYQVELLSRSLSQIDVCGKSNRSTLLSLMSLQCLKSKSNLAAQIMFDMACMEKRNIPTQLLSGPESELQKSDAIGLLKAYSIITANSSDESFTLHALVRLTIRAYLTRNNQFLTHLNIVFSRILALYPSAPEDIEYLNNCSLYTDHAVTVWKSYVELVNEADLPRSQCALIEQFASHLSRYLLIVGRYIEAKEFAKQALCWSLVDNSPSSARTLICRRSLAMADRSLGKLRNAQDAILEILEIQNMHPAAPVSEVPATLNCLAVLLQDQGQYSAAEMYYYKIISQSESLFSFDDSKTIDYVENLALTFIAQKRYVEAEDQMRAILAGRRRLYADIHLDMATTMSHLAIVLQAKEEFSEAHALYKQVLVGLETLLGPDHQEILKTKGNMTEILRHMGLYEEAEGIMRELHDSLAKTLGRDHPHTLISLGNLGILLHCQEKYADAETITEDVVSRRKIALGCNHPDTLTSMADLSVLYQCQQKYPKALLLGRQVLGGRVQALPPEHPDLIFSLRHVPELEQDLAEWQISMNGDPLFMLSGQLSPRPSVVSSPTSG